MILGTFCMWVILVAFRISRNFKAKHMHVLIGNVNEKLKLERKEHAEYTISNKWVDLSHKTIRDLIDEGRKDCEDRLFT